jgi:hypothetical protein
VGGADIAFHVGGPGDPSYIELSSALPTGSNLPAKKRQPATAGRTAYPRQSPPIRVIIR